jgi:Glycosyltransferase family 87/WD40-like Beta Propeller Repeat
VRKTAEAILPEQKAQTVASHVTQISERRRFALRWIQHLLLLVLLAGFVGKGFVPAWRHLNSDFPNYYLIARLYHAGYPLARVYEWTWLQRQKDHQGIDQGLVSFIPSTLPSALAILPWSSRPPLEAKHGWLIANLVFLGLVAFLLTRITALGWERITLLMFLTFVPLRENFLLGQEHVLVLLLLTLALWLHCKGSQFLSGASLAVAAALKIYPALFLIFLLWKKQWRAAMGLVMGLLAAAALSLSLFGKAACLLYVREVLPAGLRGESLDPYNPGWNSLTALLRRLFIFEPELNPIPVAHLPWLFALLHPLIHACIFVVFMWAIGSRKSNAERTKVEWATFVFLLLFLSSEPGTYHLVALILTSVLVADHLVASRQIALGGFALLIYALICAPMIRFPGMSATGWRNLLFFPRLAWMAILGAVLLWILVKSSGESLQARFSSRNALVAVSVVMAVTIFGFFSNEKHLDGQFENYKSRVSTTPGNLFAGNPALSQDSVFFTGMTPHGYTIRRLHAGGVVDVPVLAGDLFHPTSSQGGDSVWAEQASPHGSSIVQVSGNASGLSSAATPEIDDAQEPVVSGDGEMLAFLREVNGRNSLWIRKIGTETGGDAIHEKEIAGSEYDVHEATFTPDKRLIFSSKRSGKFSLYMTGPSGGIEELRTPTCPARYPAASPDGRWIAYSCETGGVWQLRVMDIEGKTETRVTGGDCNSISPAWTADSKRLVYATDCGRGLGLTALAEVTVSP